MNYSQHINQKQTPQSEPVLGKNQVKNAAGGYVFQITPEKQLLRFLILGTEGGTYYAAEKGLTAENAKNLVDLIQKDGVNTVQTIVSVSDSGRAVKNDAAIFALALAASFGDAKTKAAAYNAISKVCRTGTHLFTFCANIKNLRGWSRGLRTGVGKFYLDKDINSLVYQLIKYRQRNGWTHADVLRLAHPIPKDEEYNKLFKFATNKLKGDESLPTQLQGFLDISAYNDVKTINKENIKHIINLITDHKLPHEAIPNQFLSSPQVWDALVQNIPMTALFRNLARLTNIGYVNSNFDETTKQIVAKIQNQEAIKKARVHPMSVYLALRTYVSGKGLKGQMTWNPVPNIASALEKAFYLAFDNVEPTGKNHFLGIDVSGSMDWTITGSQITAREAAALMSMIAVKTEPNTETWTFGTQFARLNVSKDTSLVALAQTMRTLGMQGTDCALPMLIATKMKIPVDVFVIYTDNETWYGSIHPFQALKQYRQIMGINAKCAVVAFASQNRSIADPSDAGMMDFVGLDASIPVALRNFVIE